MSEWGALISSGTYVFQSERIKIHREMRHGDPHPGGVQFSSRKVEKQGVIGREASIFWRNFKLINILLSEIHC